MYHIKNEYLSVEISSLGAEIHKVSSVNGEKDYFWSGNPDVWNAVSPVLFPIVGKVNEDKVKYNNKDYHLTKHGYARYSEFKIISESATSVTLQINGLNLPNNMTYPFQLQFSVTYSLQGNKLLTMYHVDNLSEQIAYFSVGGHPAFKCPFDDKHLINDYVIEFEKEESLTKYGFTQKGLWDSNTTNLNLPNKQIQLEPNIFDNDALFFSGFKSDYVILKEKDSNRSIKVSTKGFPLLGFWSKPKASYICIEPWCGMGDIDEFDVELDKKPGIISIKPGAHWENSYLISFDY